MEARFSALTSPLSLADVRRLVEADLETLDDTIRTRLHSDVMLVSQVADYIVNSGGKRLRPLLVLLVARACGYTGSGHVEAAAIIEFIHTATLLHDDVVDGSDLQAGPGHGQRHVRQLGQRPGGGLPLLQGLPDDGQPGADGDHGGSRGCDKPHCRGRSDAADEYPRSGDQRGPVHGDHRVQDLQALRGRSRRGRVRSPTSRRRSWKPSPLTG